MFIFSAILVHLLITEYLALMPGTNFSNNFSQSSATKGLNWLEKNYPNETWDNLNFLIKLVDAGESTANPITPSEFHDFTNYLISLNLTHLFNQRLNQSYNINGKDSTPLMLAVEKMEVETVTLTLLKENQVNFNILDGDGNSILFYAIWDERSPRLVRDLVNLGVDWNIRGTHNWTVLHSACFYDNFELVKYFLELGLDPNDQDENRRTPLNLACLAGEKNLNQIARILIESGADKEIKDDWGKKPEDAVQRNERLSKEEKDELLKIIRGEN